MINLIGIAGGTGSGKTYTANKLLNKFGEAKIQIISLDSYYKDLKKISFIEREQNNFDHPNAFDFDLLLQNIDELKKKGSVNIPKYNYKEHLRIKEKEPINKKKIIIIEGIFSIYKKELRNKMKLKIFIDIDDKVRLKRRFNRDCKMRGRDKESILSQYNNTVKPMHIKYVNPTKKYADLILNDNFSFDILYNKINKILETNE